MEKDSNLVSIVIPTYYRNNTLPQVLESCIESTYDNTEIIVVDDSGEEHARQIATQYDVQYIAHNHNKGGNPARNTGLAAASGDYIQFLDDDDTIHEEKIESQVTQLETNDDVGVSYCGIRHRDGSVTLPSQDTTDFLRCILTFDWLPCTYSTMLTKSEYLAQIAPLPARKCNDDIGTIIDLAQITEFEYLSRPLVQHCDSNRSRGSQYGCVDIRKKIFFDEYEHLYEEYPTQVRQLGKKGISYGYIYEANDIFKNNLFSRRAIKSSIKSVLIHRNIGSLSAVAASLCGRPGWQIVKKAHQFTT
jgi:glycosyltransferase involved in cell wall biosynthesis